MMNSCVVSHVCVCVCVCARMPCGTWMLSVVEI